LTKHRENVRDTLEIIGRALEKRRKSIGKGKTIEKHRESVGEAYGFLWL